MHKLTAGVVTLLATLSLAAPPRQPVVVLLPPVAPDGLAPLAQLLAARASEQVEATGGVVELHTKQALRVVVEEQLPSTAANAEALRALLGADRALHFELTGGTPMTLTWTVVDGKKPVTGSTRVGATWSDALEQGGPALAHALLGKAPAKGPTQPTSKSEDALQALGRCYATVLRQPLSVDTPSVLDTEELDAAIVDCRAALKADPKLTFAAATLALAQAILGADADAGRTLAGLPAGPRDTLEVYTLARFWLLTRYQSNAEGVAFLREVLTRHPGEVIPRTYLGDTQLSVGDFAGAEATFRELTTLIPESPWAWGRLSKALARLGRHDEAVAAALKGSTLAPTSGEARLEYGSRLIDAGKVAQAITVLQPLAQRPTPRGEHLVRLGWAKWTAGDVDAAAADFQRALELATAPADWRTRGRAFYDLALVEAKRGKKDAARAALRQSIEAGLKVRAVDPSLAGVARELERTDADAGAPTPKLVPRETSLFPVDTFGEVDPAAKKPPPPEGLILGRF